MIVRLEPSENEDDGALTLFIQEKVESDADCLALLKCIPNLLEIDSDHDMSARDLFPTLLSRGFDSSFTYVVEEVCRGDPMLNAPLCWNWGNTTTTMAVEKHNLAILRRLVLDWNCPVDNDLLSTALDTGIQEMIDFLIPQYFHGGVPVVSKAAAIRLAQVAVDRGMLYTALRIQTCAGENGLPPRSLSIGAERGHLHVVEHCLETDARFLATNASEACILAAANGHCAIMQMVFMKALPTWSVSELESTINNMMTFAAMYGRIDCLKWCLETPSVTLRNPRVDWFMLIIQSRACHSRLACFQLMCSSNIMKPLLEENFKEVVRMIVSERQEEMLQTIAASVSSWLHVSNNKNELWFEVATDFVGSDVGCVSLLNEIGQRVPPTREELLPLLNCAASNKYAHSLVRFFLDTWPDQIRDARRPKVEGETKEQLTLQTDSILKETAGTGRFGTWLLLHRFFLTEE